MDRNAIAVMYDIVLMPSLSARRAWIEMFICIILRCSPVVALRKESVDRNCSVILSLMGNLLSLSARRAWIEISSRCGWFEIF